MFCQLPANACRGGLWKGANEPQKEDCTELSQGLTTVGRRSTKVEACGEWMGVGMLRRRVPGRVYELRMRLCNVCSTWHILRKGLETCCNTCPFTPVAGNLPTFGMLTAHQGVCFGLQWVTHGVAWQPVHQPRLTQPCTVCACCHVCSEPGGLLVLSRQGHYAASNTMWS